LAFGAVLDLALLTDWQIPMLVTGFATVPLMLPWVLLLGPSGGQPPWMAVSCLLALAFVALLTGGERPLTRVAMLIAAAPLLLRALAFAAWVDDTA
jgi:hypothetical protein